VTGAGGSFQPMHKEGWEIAGIWLALLLGCIGFFVGLAFLVAGVL